MDLFGRGKILLTGCELLVIDEADRMLDMGFIPDIEEICSKLPKSRQTLLFSATMPPPIQKLAAKFLNDPKTVEVARPATANINIEQRLVEVRSDKKRDVLRDLLRAEEVKNAIVFSNRKTTVRELATSLKRSGFAVGQIHGDMDQSDRIAEFDRFKAGEITVLVASDVAARGLDVRGVSHVINFDVPWQPDDYIHRIGRTGRAGDKGIAITLATREDGEAVAAIEKMLGQKIARAGSAPAKAASPKQRRRQRMSAEAKPRAARPPQAEAGSAPGARRGPRRRPSRGARGAEPPKAARPRAGRRPPSLAGGRGYRAGMERPAAQLPVEKRRLAGWNGPPATNTSRPRSGPGTSRAAASSPASTARSPGRPTTSSCRSASTRCSSTRWPRPTGRRSRSCSRNCSSAAIRAPNMTPG